MTSLFETLTQIIDQSHSEGISYSNVSIGHSGPAIRSPENSPSVGASGSPAPSNTSAGFPFPLTEDVVCQECGKEFRDRTAWRNHQRNHKEFPCPQCDYVARRRDHLRSHVLTRHENDKPYKCSECDFSTVYHSNYKNHVAMHSEQKAHAISTHQQDAGFGGAAEWITSIFEDADDSTANPTAPLPCSEPAPSVSSVEKFVIIPSEQAPPKRKRSKRSIVVAPVPTSPASDTPINASSPKQAKAEVESEISQLVKALDPVPPTKCLQCRSMTYAPPLRVRLTSIPAPKVDRSPGAAACLSSFLEHAAENAALRRQLADKDAEIAWLQNEKREAAANADALLARIEQLEKQLDTRNQLVTKLTLKLNGMDDE